MMKVGVTPLETLVWLSHCRSSILLPWKFEILDLSELHRNVEESITSICGDLQSGSLARHHIPKEPTRTENSQPTKMQKCIESWHLLSYEFFFENPVFCFFLSLSSLRCFAFSSCSAFATLTFSWNSIMATVGSPASS